MENTVENNRKVWGKSHHWSGDGDEWSGQAHKCGVSYDVWKKSLVDHLIAPYAEHKDVVEIAPGFGRWTEFLAASAKSVHLVDINENCLEKCRERFAGNDKLSFALTSGNTLPGAADASTDLVFSFDSFVHMAPEIIGRYL